MKRPKDISDAHAALGRGELKERLEADAAEKLAIEATSAKNAKGTRAGHEPSMLAPLTIRTIREILAINHDDADFLLENGCPTRGERTAMCGMGGAGKSRLVMQLAMCCRAGHNFIGWRTCGKDTRWLFLQSENSTRRLQSELRKMLSAFSQCEQEQIIAGLFFHTLEGDVDGFLALGDARNRERISQAIETTQPHVVVCDPLRHFASDDLNSDEEMRQTLSWLQRIIRKGNAERVPVIIHHAGTGRAGIAKTTGFDRSSFGRTAKFLLAGRGRKSTFRP